MADSTISPLHDRMANAIRALAMDAVQAAKSGHPGMPMGMADAATVLFAQFLKFDPQRPDWPDRDRFVLSAGHGSMLLYALLHLTGYPDMTMAELRNFRQLHSRTAGHPEYGAAPGIETTTGPLGQGLANAVGMALAERMMNARFGDDLVDHRTWAVAGDGCLMEGISQEAITLAGHLGLGRLIVLFDDNGISIDGPTGLATSDDQAGRFEACGWHVQQVDGHDPAALAAAMQAACDSDRPSMIACRTVIGYGAPTKAGTAATHGAPLGEEEIAGTREGLDWRHPPFEIPADVAEAWRTAGARGAADADAWEARLAAADAGVRAAFRRVADGALPAGLGDAVGALKQQFAAEAPKMATRQASGKVLDRLTEVVPELAGGSADLTGSNNTRAAGHSDIAAGDFSGGYIRYGVREHGMAAAMNGMALHGGLIPYGGTFLVFTDYARPAIRLSALMEQRVIYVMTHDSIGLGEDGPTHQPVEHLAALRAMPNLNVFRPCDAVEVAECWELALQARETPSVLALTRQGLPTLRTEHRAENACARGAYVLAEAGGERQATLLASGSEVSIAVEAQALLKAEGIEAAVVSMPCWELFERQPDDYRAAVLGDAPRIACEAASGFGWTRWTGDGGGFVGMKSFGASAPAPHLYEHFGVTAAAVADAARTVIAGRG
ncbi:MAG: transketolase [Rhodospirillaceae bacterium]|nr:transketolase [Rhodospirillaceae bacterium]MYB13315.1 transketolase [Rhodospirillaceae bacterium]MYI48120.1 transketolase [Rhodospirillaceae bacterium]